MATQKNYVELTGIVGNSRVSQVGGTKVARITLATNYAYRDSEGCPVITTSWHALVCWEGNDIRDLDSIARCDRLHVTGRLRYQKYCGIDGGERTCVEILVTSLEKLEGDEPLEMETE